MQVAAAAAALLFYLRSDKRQRRCFFCQTAAKNFSSSGCPALHTFRLLFTRGGVEDTRLEAKANDTKKNPRPRPAFLRTDLHEFKDRNARGQEPRTQAQVFSKKQYKKRSSKNCFRRSQKEENKKDLRKFSARFLAFFYIILK